VAPLLEAAGVHFREPRLVVMPDDPALGEYRKTFAGMLGTFEERPRGKKEEAGSVDTYDLFELLEKGDSLDTRAFLAARLVDLLVGDWDRHADQWRWERDSLNGRWTPIPRDRDQAFAKFDGLLLTLARTTYPQLVEWSDEYPGMTGLTWNGRPLDRRLLPVLERPTWDSVARELQARITDSVIAVAVSRLPREHQEIAGRRLEHDLRRRRDALPAAADRFYRFLAHQVDLTLTDDADHVAVERRPDGELDVRVLAPDGAERVHRVFHPGETSEVRLYLHGGADRVEVTGEGGGGPLLRVIGGNGADTVVDQSRGLTRVYDDRDPTTVTGRVRLDRRQHDEPRLTEKTPVLPRDWGHLWRFTPWVTTGPEIGLFLGLGTARYSFGFRKQPYSSRWAIRVGYSTGADAPRAELEGDVRRIKSDVQGGLLLRASGIEVVRFYGFGNATSVEQDDAFYRVFQQQYLVAPRLTLPVMRRTLLRFGPVLKFAITDLDDAHFISVARPYGSDDFGQVGLQASLVHDSRDLPGWPTRGLVFSLGGSAYPAVWDVEETFGELHAEAVTYLSAAIPSRPTLALRAGGMITEGQYPFHEAAWVGGATTVRGLKERRYAGDASAFGSAELRLHLGRFKVELPGTWGPFAFVDAGRVFLEGESSRDWHTGIGGGLWFAFLNNASTLSVSIARSEDYTAFYLKSGFVF
jgi:hypothetical protein